MTATHFAIAGVLLVFVLATKWTSRPGETAGILFGFPFIVAVALVLAAIHSIWRAA
jgi:hypothetical protein